MVHVRSKNSRSDELDGLIIGSNKSIAGWCLTYHCGSCTVNNGEYSWLWWCLRIIWLVVQCAHLEKWWSESQWEGWHPIYEMENNIHLWNHQPETHFSCSFINIVSMLSSSMLTIDTLLPNELHFIFYQWRSSLKHVWDISFLGNPLGDLGDLQLLKTHGFCTLTVPMAIHGYTNGDFVSWLQRNSIFVDCISKFCVPICSNTYPNIYP